MQPKKNPKADLSKNSSLYFVIGLSVILLISWQAIEWKTYEKDLYGYEALNVDDDDDESMIMVTILLCREWMKNVLM